MLIEPSSDNFLALLFVLFDFKALAWAFPLPSAKDSAKFANKTVKNNHEKIQNSKPNKYILLSIFCDTKINSEKIVPKYTRKIIGFLICFWGNSFIKLSFKASLIICLL